MATPGSPSTEGEPPLDGTADPYQYSTAETTLPHASQTGEVPLTRPTDPILPFVEPPTSRRRRSEWLLLAVLMVIASILMVGCCVAGFAFSTGQS